MRPSADRLGSRTESAKSVSCTYSDDGMAGPWPNHSRHQQVGWLDVAMNDPNRMCGGESLRNMDGEIEELTAVRRRRDRRTIHILHDEIVRPDVVQLADMRMIQRRDGS